MFYWMCDLAKQLKNQRNFFSPPQHLYSDIESEVSNVLAPGVWWLMSNSINDLNWLFIMQRKRIVSPLVVLYCACTVMDLLGHCCCWCVCGFLRVCLCVIRMGDLITASIDSSINQMRAYANRSSIIFDLNLTNYIVNILWQICYEEIHQNILL